MPMRFVSSLPLLSACCVSVMVCLSILAGCDSRHTSSTPTLNELTTGKASHGDNVPGAQPFGIGDNPGVIGEVSDDGADSLKKMFEDGGAASFGRVGSSKNYSPGDSCIGVGMIENSLNNQPGLSPTDIVPQDNLQGAGGSSLLDSLTEPDG